MAEVETARRYKTTHPWITFELAVHQHDLWASLGEALSKCMHLAGTPLTPRLAASLASTTLIRGAVATTAIEGNTLTVEEVKQLKESGRRLPESQAYLQQEVDNVIAALQTIDDEMENGTPFRLSTEWIKDQNAKILDGLEREDHVVPGAYTEVQLGVGPYRAAPPEDVEYLMDTLVTWLNEVWLAPCRAADATPEARFFGSFFAAVLAHLYIAWTHPFGDGNGRTARLVECALLAHSGVVPWISSNLLSDHYNRTRSRYYRALNNASTHSDVMGFINYSAEGFVDMLREQIGEVQQMQRHAAWVNYVHEVMAKETTGDTQRRRREVVLRMSESGVRRADVRYLSPHIAEWYADKQEKTVTRDLNKLRDLGLVTFIDAHRVAPSIGMMDAFKPATAGG